MPSKSVREWVYAELDDVRTRIAGMTMKCANAGDYENASWLAIAENVLAKFNEDDFDDLMEAEGERRFERAYGSASDENAEDQLLYLMAEARKLK